MNSTFGFRVLVTCGALLGGFWAGEALGASGSFQQSLSIDEPFVLDVSTGSGTINISAGDSRQVEITGHITVSSGSFLGFFKRNSEEMKEQVRQLKTNHQLVSLMGVCWSGI